MLDKINFRDSFYDEMIKNEINILLPIKGDHLKKKLEEIKEGSIENYRIGIGPP